MLRAVPAELGLVARVFLLFGQLVLLAQAVPFWLVAVGLAVQFVEPPLVWLGVLVVWRIEH